MTLVLIGDTRSKYNIERLRSVGWGRMFSSARPTPYDGEKWGFDNGAYKNYTNGKPFDEIQFEKRVIDARIAGVPYLAVCPDIVAAGLHSLNFSLGWVAKLRVCEQTRHWPWYLAVQDGMTIHDVEPFVCRFDGIFLGGSDTFKQQAWRWRVFAKDNGKPFHYGRAGTFPKLESALKMKADSLDSAFPLWEKSRFDRFIRQFDYWEKNPRPHLEFA